MRIPEYPHLKLIGVRAPMPGEAVIATSGAVYESEMSGINMVRPIVAPDNAYDAMDLSALKIPEGYEIDGPSAAEAFGEMVPGDIGLHSYKTKAVKYYGAPIGPDTRRIRLRKVAPKTRTWVIAESCDPWLVEVWSRTGASSPFSVRFEERPL